MAIDTCTTGRLCNMQNKQANKNSNIRIHTQKSLPITLLEASHLPIKNSQISEKSTKPNIIRLTQTEKIENTAETIITFKELNSPTVATRPPP
jgi:hypothetical protein